MAPTSIREGALREGALRDQETQMVTDARPEDGAANAIKVYKATDRRSTCGAMV